LNVLAGVLDAAGLAMQAVLGIDLQLLATSDLIRGILIHSSWAVPA
jgi:hypothetical protein